MLLFWKILCETAASWMSDRVLIMPLSRCKRFSLKTSMDPAYMRLKEK